MNEQDAINQMRSIVNEHVDENTIHSSRLMFSAYLVPFVLIPFKEPVDLKTLERLAAMPKVKYVAYDVICTMINYSLN
jgi:hypothetical protein